MTRDALFRATKLAPASLNDPLPSGVVGRFEGVALTYNVVDDHGTIFEPGCLSRTMRERVAAGKVKVYLDHGDAPYTGGYNTRLHVGTVRRLEDREIDGQRVAWMVADLFDTEPGREAHEYLMAVQATGGETGLSIGMIWKAAKYVQRVVDGVMRDVFTEVPLREISITAESSVPGTAVAAVRGEIDYTPFLRGIHAALGDDAFRAQMRALLGDAETPPDSDAGQTPDSDAAPLDSPQPATVAAVPEHVPYEARLAFVRAHQR